VSTDDRLLPLCILSSGALFPPTNRGQTQCIHSSAPIPQFWGWYTVFHSLQTSVFASDIRRPPVFSRESEHLCWAYAVEGPTPVEKLWSLPGAASRIFSFARDRRVVPRWWSPSLHPGRLSVAFNPLLHSLTGRFVFLPFRTSNFCRTPIGAAWFSWFRLAATLRATPPPLPIFFCCTNRAARIVQMRRFDGFLPFRRSARGQSTPPLSRNCPKSPPVVFPLMCAYLCFYCARPRKGIGTGSYTPLTFFGRAPRRFLAIVDVK